MCAKIQDHDDGLSNYGGRCEKQTNSFSHIYLILRQQNLSNKYEQSVSLHVHLLRYDRNVDEPNTSKKQNNRWISIVQNINN